MTDKQRKIAIFGFYVMVVGCAGASCISTVMSIYIAKFSQYSMTTVYQIVTLPALGAMFLSMGAGFIIGRKLSWKATFILSALLYSVGILPVFYNDNLYFLIACNVVARLGMTLHSYRSAAALNFFGAEKGGKMIAWMATIASAAIVVLQKLVGWLGTISDGLPWLIYAGGFLALIAVLFLIKIPGFDKLPENENAGTDGAEKKKDKIRLSPYIFVMVGLNLIYGLATQYPIMLGTSQFVASLGMGDTNVAGTIASCATIATMLIGPTYGFVEKITKRFLMAFACILTASGVALFSFAPSIITCCIGTGLRNYGWALVSTSIITYMGSVTRPQEKALMNSVNMVVNSLANYISAYYLAFIGNVFYGGDSVVGPIQFGVFVAIALAVVAIIKDPRPKAYIEATTVKLEAK